MTPAARSAPPTDEDLVGAEGLERAVRPLLDALQRAAEELEERVSPAHLRALQALDLTGPVQVTALGEAMSLLPSTASRLSDRLAAAGLITRSVSPTNRRATLLELTPAGRAVLADLARARSTRLAAVLGAMEPDDRAAFRRGVSAFAAATDLGGDGVPRARDA